MEMTTTYSLPIYLSRVYICTDYLEKLLKSRLIKGFI